jgi:hypothetical protein
MPFFCLQSTFMRLLEAEMLLMACSLQLDPVEPRDGPLHAEYNKLLEKYDPMRVQGLPGGQMGQDHEQQLKQVHEERLEQLSADEWKQLRALASPRLLTAEFNSR